MITHRTISQFAPLPGQPRDESDHHYRTIHTPFARRLLRTMDDVDSYHVGISEAQRDLAGGWNQAPTTFRWISIRFRGEGFAPTPAVREAIVEDHRHFLSDHRTHRVEEKVLLDRMAQNTSLVKYVVEFDREVSSPRTTSRRLFEERCTLAAQLAEECFGVRLVVSNLVLETLRSDPVDHPGQRPTREQDPTSLRVGFLEIWADQHEWVEQWWNRDDVGAALGLEGWSRVRATRVAEECGFDRR